jgi:hypothetical protein
MKRANTLFCILLLLTLVNCETERIIFNGPYFVRFTESSRTEKESASNIIEIEVHQSQPVLEEDITITYTIGGDAREGIDYTVLGERGRVSIDKGEFFGVIKIQLINNANNIIRSQDIVLTLRTVSTNALQVGQDESAMGITYTLTIVDDCILGGTYTGKLGSYSDRGIDITSADCENYTLSNWNLGLFYARIGAFRFPPAMDLKFIDNGDNSLTIPNQEEENLSADVATIEGFGSENPLTNEITFTIILVDFDREEIQITLTRN